MITAKEEWESGQKTRDAAPWWDDAPRWAENQAVPLWIESCPRKLRGN
jgi:hypothetical protein